MKKISRRNFMQVSAVAMMAGTLSACGAAASSTAASTAASSTAASSAGSSAAAASVKLASFKMGSIDKGSQDGTSVPLRNNLEAAIKALGGTSVTVQPAGTTTDDYLDALDTLISQGVDAVNLAWVNFQFTAAPAAVQKCEDAGIYYGFYWTVDVETLGDDTLAICKDSPYFLGCFYQQENDAAYNAMKTLHESGCDKLGYIGLPASNEMRENSRDYGIQQACKDFGMTILVEQRDATVTATAEGGATTMENFLTAFPEMQGLVIAGMTQFVMPGVDQVLTSKNLTSTFKVGAIDFPDNMDTYAQNGELIFDAGAHITGPVYITILAANALNGTPLIDKGRSFNQQYIQLASADEIESWVKIADELVYNDDELLQCLQVVNPSFDVDAFDTMVKSYSYSDIMKRHHS